MRVGAVLPLYPPDSLVGSWLTTHAFLRDLVSRGHDVEVKLYLGPHRPDYEIDGVRVEVLAEDRDGTRLSPTGPTPDLVVHHLGDRGLGRSSWPSAPHVLMVHGRDRAIQASAETADLVVFNSEASAADVDLSTVKSWIVAHPPLDVTAVEPGDLITLVNTSVKKGGDVLRLLSASMRHKSFLGVRGGYGRPVIPRARNVEILPPQADMAEVYRRTRILLMPSTAESWGRTGLEAMTSGIPVIAHPTDGLRESLGDAGIFVDRRYLRGWRTAITALDDPAAYEEASLRCRAHAAAFSSELQLERFAAAVEALNAKAPDPANEVRCVQER
jgi:Glycosyl transferases group 1